MLTADGFDRAVLGVVKCKGRPDVVCYDYSKCIEILVTRDGVTREQAEEYMEHSVVDAYVGPHTPAFLQKCSAEEVRGWDEGAIPPLREPYKGAIREALMIRSRQIQCGLGAKEDE